ncbi:hypothetical protein CMI47_11010 [Candidatus Pacearchaeota archaeon]|nr:hypothetical protein [Candidatus Pacearchaeota archaeon]|tara:strand:- start:56 stop:844 length:789 start_codon:yes stop_codon:yes gene_type:complete
MSEEIIYGKSEMPSMLDTGLGCLKVNGARGVVYNSRNLGTTEEHVARWCESNNLEFILALQCKWDDNDLIEKAKTYTNKLAIGNLIDGEWFGGPNRARRYAKAARKHKIEWFPLITHRCILTDLKNGWLIPILEDFTCICFCGYIVAGYLFADEKVPHQDWRPKEFITNGQDRQGYTTITGENLNEKYGATVESFTEYVSSMTMISGVGWQPGLKIGTRVYAKKLGFKGIISGLPFDLKGTDQIEVKDKPERYPDGCGIFPY